MKGKVDEGDVKALKLHDGCFDYVETSIAFSNKILLTDDDKLLVVGRIMKEISDSPDEDVGISL